MRLALGAFLFLVAVTSIDAQQPLGLSPNNQPGIPLKLDGIVLEPVADGYLAVSLPPEVIKKFVLLIAKTEFKIHTLGLVELVDEKIKKLEPRSDKVAVPIGICFLNTKEVFSHHKVLDRTVQAVGTYAYVNHYGKTITVPAYEGGPISR